jgi:hypothetical protein
LSDEGVSELLGYAVLAGVVITAVLCIASGVGGVVTSAAVSAGYSEAGLAVRSFATAVSDAACASNTYYTASEVRVPAGYELVVLDSTDDMARFTISAGSREIFDRSLGSVRLRSPFRSVTYEGGAVFADDSGLIDVVHKPSVFTAGESGRLLYIFLPAVKADTTVIAGGRSVVLDVRAMSGEKISVAAEGPIKISVASTCPDGWSAVFRDAGFQVTQENGKVIAIMGGITDVSIDCTTLEVRTDG